MSVRPSIFLYAKKHSKPRGNRAINASVYFNGQRPAIVKDYCHQRSGPSRLADTDPSNSDTATAVCVCVEGGGVCVCVCTLSRGCVRTRVRACTCVRSSVRSCVCACVRTGVMCLEYTIIIFDPG